MQIVTERYSFGRFLDLPGREYYNLYRIMIAYIGVCPTSKGVRRMFNKFSRWITCVLTLICTVLGMTVNALALNPIMGDETQGTVKLMTVLLIGSAVLIVVLVALSALKKGKK